VMASGCSPARRREVPGPTGRPPSAIGRYLARRTGAIPENSRKRQCRVAAAADSVGRRTTVRITAITNSHFTARAGHREPGISPDQTPLLRCSPTFHEVSRVQTITNRTSDGLSYAEGRQLMAAPGRAMAGRYAGAGWGGAWGTGGAWWADGTWPGGVWWADVSWWAGVPGAWTGPGLPGGGAGAASGKPTLIPSPPPGSACACHQAPCASAIAATIDSPSPSPFRLPVRSRGAPR
jgi:hypothetical protein